MAAPKTFWYVIESSDLSTSKRTPCMPTVFNADLGRFWTLPNALSLLRGVLVIPVAVLLWQGGPLDWTLGLIGMIVLTDWLDGRVARWTQTVSDWGKVIDPVADKFGAILSVAVLTFRAVDPHLPLWFFGVVVGRDLAILVGGVVLARRSGQIAMSAWAGKAASLWLALTVLSVVLKADPAVFNVCLWMTTGLLLISFVVYLVRSLRLFHRSSPPHGSGTPGRDRPGSDDSPGRTLPDAVTQTA